MFANVRSSDFIIWKTPKGFSVIVVAGNTFLRCSLFTGRWSSYSISQVHITFKIILTTSGGKNDLLPPFYVFFWPFKTNIYWALWEDKIMANLCIKGGVRILFLFACICRVYRKLMLEAVWSWGETGQFGRQGWEGDFHYINFCTCWVFNPEYTF